MKYTHNLFFVGFSMIAFTPTNANAENSEKTSKPNVIYIMADDLGIGDLGCYGQRYIKTPTIDALAANGMKFTQHYSGSTVCAPSRCSLMTGKHIGHAFIRGNEGVPGPDSIDYDYPLADGELTVAEVFKQAGYKTGCTGKWGLGGPENEGRPNNQGFDYFYGYLGQGNAHRYYPMFLWENQTKIMLYKKAYSPDSITKHALNFIRENAEKPFFLYFSPTIPHADLIVPEGELGEYDGKFPETPYKGGGYIAQPKPNATFAAMVTRLDGDVKKVLDLLKELGLDKNTLVIFTSDNGTHIEGGHDPYFFDSNGPFRGTKRDLYEGGVRAPFIANWPGVIAPGSISFHVSAFWDFLPTVSELIGVKPPKEIDGISYLPTLTGKGKQKNHSSLYFEFHEQGGKQSVLKDNWKLIRLNVDKPTKMTEELYNLNSDPGEQCDVAAQYPKKVKELEALIDQSHTKNNVWKFKNEEF